VKVHKSPHGEFPAYLGMLNLPRADHSYVGIFRQDFAPGVELSVGDPIFSFQQFPDNIAVISFLGVNFAKNSIEVITQEEINQSPLPELLLAHALLFGHHAENISEVLLVIHVKKGQRPPVALFDDVGTQVASEVTQFRSTRIKPFRPLLLDARVTRSKSNGPDLRGVPFKESCQDRRHSLRCQGLWRIILHRLIQALAEHVQEVK
jgi:hypothetical protein